MNTATITLVILAAGLWLYAWRRGDGSHQRGLVQGWRTLRRTLVLLLIAFTITGYVEVLLPIDLVQSWLGPNSGWRGLLLGEGVGLMLPGGPYVIFPLIAVFYNAGAGLGPAVTVVTTWTMLSPLRLGFEIPFMGWRFTVIRIGLSLIFPLLAGLAAQFFFGR